MAALLGFFFALCSAAICRCQDIEIISAMAVDDQCESHSPSCALQALQLQSRVLENKRGRDALNGTEDLGTACLCVFDIDRTLTQKQGSLQLCPQGMPVPGVVDTAYGGGVLTLSQLAAAGIGQTFCGSCYLGICSHGDASGGGSAERQVIAYQVLANSLQLSLRNIAVGALTWSDGDSVHSPLVVRQGDGQKPMAVEGILGWYSSQGVSIPRSSVYFFDDKEVNVASFRGTGMNARQVSCMSRDRSIDHGEVGLCGAHTQEVVALPGVHTC